MAWTCTLKNNCTPIRCKRWLQITTLYEVVRKYMRDCGVGENMDLIVLTRKTENEKVGPR